MTLNHTLTIALGMTALLGAAAANAEQLKRAQVPFAFEVAGQRMEPGTYEATRNKAGGAMMIFNRVTGESASLLPTPLGVGTSDQSTLTFHCYGSQCFLNKIQFGEAQTSYQVQPSKHEKELARVEPRQDTLVALR